MRYTYNDARKLLASIKGDLDILAGNTVGPSDVSWQDVAGTLSVNLRVLASRVDEARRGNVKDGPAVFPSWDDLEE